MKLLPERRLGIFLMVVSAIFPSLQEYPFHSFVIRDWQQDTFPKFDFEYPIEYLPYLLQ